MKLELTIQDLVPLSSLSFLATTRASWMLASMNSSEEPCRTAEVKQDDQNQQVIVPYICNIVTAEINMICSEKKGVTKISSKLGTVDQKKSLKSEVHTSTLQYTYRGSIRCIN